jgi:hypothetical protein
MRISTDEGISYYDVGVKDEIKFTPSRGITIDKQLSQYVFFDEGESLDKFITEFNVRAESSIIDELKQKLIELSKTNLYVIIENGEEILGPAVDYQTGYYNAILINDPINFNYADLYYSEMTLRMEFYKYNSSTAITYLPGITDSMPEIFFSTNPQGDADHSVTSYSVYDSTIVKNNIIKNDSDDFINIETVSFNAEHCKHANMIQLQYFYSNGGRSQFSFTTDKVKLFNNSITNNVLFLSLEMRRESSYNWTGVITFSRV